MYLQAATFSLTVKPRRENRSLRIVTESDATDEKRTCADQAMIALVQKTIL